MNLKWARGYHGIPGGVCPLGSQGLGPPVGPLDPIGPHLPISRFRNLNTCEDTEKQSIFSRFWRGEKQIGVENGNFGLFFASKLWDRVGLSWRPYFQIREAPRVQFSQKRDEKDNGEGIRETRWLIYCFADFKAKLLQNSALKTRRCFRPFTILI